MGSRQNHVAANIGISYWSLVISYWLQFNDLYIFKIKKNSLLRGMNKEFSLSYQDSNLDKQSQNLLCYHYTIAQQQRQI